MEVILPIARRSLCWRNITPDPPQALEDKKKESVENEIEANAAPMQSPDYKMD